MQDNPSRNIVYYLPAAQRNESADNDKSIVRTLRRSRESSVSKNSLVNLSKIKYGLVAHSKDLDSVEEQATIKDGYLSLHKERKLRNKTGFFLVKKNKESENIFKMSETSHRTPRFGGLSDCQQDSTLSMLTGSQQPTNSRATRLIMESRPSNQLVGDINFGLTFTEIQANGVSEHTSTVFMDQEGVIGNDNPPWHDYKLTYQGEHRRNLSYEPKNIKVLSRSLDIRPKSDQDIAVKSSTFKIKRLQRRDSPGILVSHNRNGSLNFRVKNSKLLGVSPSDPVPTNQLRPLFVRHTNKDPLAYGQARTGTIYKKVDSV